MRKRKNIKSHRNNKKKKVEMKFLEIVENMKDNLILDFYSSYKNYRNKNKTEKVNIDYLWFGDINSLGDIIEKPNILGKGVSGTVFNFKTKTNEYAVKIITNPEFKPVFEGSKDSLIAEIKFGLVDGKIELKDFKQEVEIQKHLSLSGIAPKVHSFGFLLQKTQKGYYTHCFIISEKLEMNVREYIKKETNLRLLETKLLETIDLLSESDFVCVDFKPENMVINTANMCIKVIDFEARFCIPFADYLAKLNKIYPIPINKEKARYLLKLTYLYITVGLCLKDNYVLCLKSMLELWKKIEEPDDFLLECFLNIRTNGGETFANNIEYYFDRYQLFNLFKLLIKSDYLQTEAGRLKKEDYPEIFNSMKKPTNFCAIL